MQLERSPGEGVGLEEQEREDVRQPSAGVRGRGAVEKEVGALWAGSESHEEEVMFEPIKTGNV